MNKKFLEKIWPACCLAGSLLLVTGDQCLSQGSEDIGKAEKTLARIDSLLAVEDYYKNRDKVPTLQKLLEQLDNRLERIKDLHPSVEWRNTYQSYKDRLEKRRNAYTRATPPFKETVAEQTLKDCISRMENYVADTSRSVFVDTTSASDRFVQRAFLSQLAPCLNAFAKDERSLRQASPVLTKMFIYKRIDVLQWIELLDQNNATRNQFGALLVEKGKIEATARLLAEIFRTGRDTQRLTDLIHKLFAATDSTTTFRLFESILTQFGNDPEKMAWLKLQIAQGSTHQPQTKLLKPLEELIEHFRNETLVASIFRLLIETVPPNTSSPEWQMAKAMEIVENDILQRAGDRFELATRLDTLARRAKSIAQARRSGRLRLALQTIWHTGGAPMETAYYRAMVDTLRQTYTRDYEVEIIPAGMPAESEKNTLQKSTWGDKVSLPGPLLQRADLLVAGNYSFFSAKKNVELNLRVVEIRTGIVLGVYHVTVDAGKDLAAFRRNVRQVGRELVQALSTDLSSFLEFELFSKSFTAEKGSLDKFRAYLFYGTIFDVEPSEKYETLQGLVVDHIYIEEDFFQTRAGGERFRPFVAALQENLAKFYPDLLPIVLPDAGIKKATEDSAKNFLYIKGESLPENPWAAKIVIRRNYENVLQIRLKFDPAANTGAISTPQATSAAGYVTESIKAFLGFNQKYFTEAVERKAKALISNFPDSARSLPVSRWNALPSLLMPGTSQLIIANRLVPPSNNSQKRWGRFFLAAETALLSAAIYFDRQAIRDVDNDALKTRNRFLLGAGGLGAVSAIKACINIRSHNRSIKSVNSRN